MAVMKKAMKKLISRNTKGQYRKIDYGRVKTIKGKKYDRTILKAADIAVKGAGDGRISQKDAKIICRACRPTKDGRSTYSAMEKGTMAYVRKNYKFTAAGDKAVRTFIAKMGAKQGARTKAMKAMKVMKAMKAMKAMAVMKVMKAMK
ncbi:unnamed protein product [Symbiodinium natans]|uniref:Uncharacterized protein n=1 Tax=Symbiodinium natans TaxID=878477 RepID=A0A812SDL2_9DINO|nr:unnamed protein product [Symbiodinium natans]